MNQRTRAVTIVLYVHLLASLPAMAGCADTRNLEGDPYASDGSTVDVADTHSSDLDVPDETVQPRYVGVSISDPSKFHCRVNGNHGADLDAVELVLPSTAKSVFVTEAVRFEVQSLWCTVPVNSQSQEVQDVYGPPDGTLGGGYLSLAGGYVNVGFGREIPPDAEIKLHEVGEDECGELGCVDDPMVVGLVTDLNCTIDDPSCYKVISSEAVGDATIPWCP